MYCRLDEWVPSSIDRLRRSFIEEGKCFARKQESKRTRPMLCSVVQCSAVLRSAVHLCHQSIVSRILCLYLYTYIYLYACAIRACLIKIMNETRITNENPDHARPSTQDRNLTARTRTKPKNSTRPRAIQLKTAKHTKREKTLILLRLLSRSLSSYPTLSYRIVPSVT